MSFARNLCFRHHFSSQQLPTCPPKPNSPLDKFKPPSNWDTPPLPADHPVEQYLNFPVQNVSDTEFANNLDSNTQHNLTDEE